MVTVKELLNLGINNLEEAEISLQRKIGKAQIRQAFQMMTHKDVTEDDDSDEVIRNHPDCEINNFLELPLC